MRFMLMVKGDSEPGVMPSEELLAAMGKYNEELMKAGVLLDGSGLHPSAEGARVRFAGGKRTVIDGPFTETKELVAGYWLIQVKSKDEAIEWAKRVPFEAGGEYGEEAEIEIRQLFELEDFGEGPAIDRMRELEKDLAKSKE
ncbi:MAG: YciI family protein [Actinobacteria bacterium]|nr:YciI family protein [Actinomycetota bacterium]